MVGHAPLQSAAEKEQLEIVQFLVKTCTNKVASLDRRIVMVGIVYILLRVFKEECSNASISH